jgi:hypothetical protein
MANERSPLGSIKFVAIETRADLFRDPSRPRSRQPMDEKCIRYEKGDVGYPCIAPLGRDQCVVADWTGQLTVVDVIAKRALDRVFVGAVEGLACSTLRSLDVTTTTPRMAAAATRGGYAAVYDLDHKKLEKVYPQKGGTVIPWPSPVMAAFWPLALVCILCRRTGNRLISNFGRWATALRNT